MGLDERGCVEASDAVRGRDAWVGVGGRSSKSCVNTGCGVGPDGADGGGSHVCSLEAVVVGV